MYLKRLVGKADARAQLVGVDILPHLIEAQPGVHRQLIGDFPLVLGIDAGEPTEFRNIVADRFSAPVVRSWTSEVLSTWSVRR